MGGGPENEEVHRRSCLFIRKRNQKEVINTTNQTREQENKFYDPGKDFKQQQEL